MIDAAYRLLGLVVQGRYQIGFVLAVLNTAFILAELHFFLPDPSPANFLTLIDTPLILGLAAYLLAQLPPGVVFRRQASTSADGVPAQGEPLKLPRGCRVTARFRVGEEWEWRLLAPCTLGLGDQGIVEVLLPSLGDSPRRRLAFRRARRGEWPTAGGRVPMWGADPALIQRLARERDERQLAPLGPLRLAIPRATLLDAAPGWQYVGLRRVPAIRLTWDEFNARERYGYLAFDEPEVRDALTARLRPRLFAQAS